MALNVFTAINYGRMAKLRFLTTLPYIHNTNKHKIDVVHIIEDQENMVKVIKLLNGGSGSISSGDKVYIFPQCKIPGYKIKEHCKKIGASIVTDYEKATVYIGTAKSHSYSEKDSVFSTLIVTSRFSNYMYEGDAQFIRDNIINKFKDIEVSDLYKTIESSGYDHYLISYSKLDNTHKYRTDTIITPLAANIIYRILGDKIPVISEEELAKQISPTGPLDEEMYQSLVTMFRSYDEDNKKIAQEILYNCDVENSIYYIFKLTRSVGIGTMLDNRNKNSKLFAERSNIYRLYNLNDDKVIQYLSENYSNQLTSEVFAELIPKAASKFSRYLSHDLFEVTLTLRDQYKKYNEEFNIKVK